MNFELNPKLKIFHREAALGDKIVIVDNFYKNPEEIRSFLINSRLNLGVKNFYGETHLLESNDTRNLETFASKELSGDFSCFSFLAKVTTNESWPHIDKFPVADVVYLNRGKEIDGGTGFFKHRKSGVSRVDYFRNSPNYEKAALDHNFLSTKEFTDFHFCDRDSWEMYDSVEMKYNRALFYSAGMYHNSYFEKDFYNPQNPRLSQNIFFKFR